MRFVLGASTTLRVPTVSWSARRVRRLSLLASAPEEIPAIGREMVNRRIECALAKYPAEAIGRELEGVAVVRELRLAGAPVLGLAFPGSRWIAIAMSGLSLDELEMSFHHELSHLLYRRYLRRFPRREWRALNPADFRYGVRRYASAIRGESDTIPDPELFGRGILHPYAATSEEEDLASIAERLLMSEEPVLRWARGRSMRIQEKIGLTERFYRDVLPGFVPPPHTRGRSQG